MWLDQAFIFEIAFACPTWGKERKRIEIFQGYLNKNLDHPFSKLIYLPLFAITATAFDLSLIILIQFCQVYTFNETNYLHVFQGNKKDKKLFF